MFENDNDRAFEILTNDYLSVKEELENRKKADRAFIDNRLSNYRSISKAFFSDKKIRYLSITDKIIFLFILIDGRFTQDFGVCFASIDDIAFQLDLTLDAVTASIERLEAECMIEVDTECDEILIMNFYKYNWAKNNWKFGKGLLKKTLMIQNPDFRDYVEARIHEVMIDRAEQT